MRSASCLGFLAMLAVFLSVASPAGAQADRQQRIQALESRIADAKQKLWVEYVERLVDGDPTCSFHKAKAKEYYDQALALNDQYQGRATVDYQRQITEVKALNQRHLADYKACFERVLATAGDRRSYDRFNADAYAVFERLNDAPRDTQTYLAQLEAQLQALLDEEEDFVGTVASVFDQAEVSRNGGPFEPLQRGMKLLVGDRVLTGPRGRVRVELAGCSDRPGCGPRVINIGSFTEVRMANFKADPPRINGLMDVIKGSIRLFFKGLAGSHSQFEVRAGTSICGIRGTDISLVYDPTQDKVDYLLNEGEVEISTPRSGRLTLQAGQQVTVQQGSAGPLRTLDSAAWNSALAVTGNEPAAGSGAPSSQPRTPVDDRFGALAYSEAAGGGGFAYNSASQGAAEGLAINNCRQATQSGDCRLLIWFRNACGAFARAGNGAYGAAWGSNQAEADAAATRLCKSYGGSDCQVLQRVCARQ